MARTFRIGTRGSPMALAQTDYVKVSIKKVAPELQIEVVVINTEGDADQTSPTIALGGKGGAFVRKIRDKLRTGEIQAAMHSLKDMPGNEEHGGLCIGAVLEREAPNDVLVVRRLDLGAIFVRRRNDRHIFGQTRGIRKFAVPQE